MRYVIDVPYDWSGRWPVSNLAGRLVEAVEDSKGDLVDLRIFEDGQLLDVDSEPVVSLEGEELLAVLEAYRADNLDAVYMVSIQAAGCLPDSDAYPYFVGGLEAAKDALRFEMTNVVPDSVEGRDYADMVISAVRTLDAEGCVAVPLEGSYCLSVVRDPLVTS